MRPAAFPVQSGRIPPPFATGASGVPEEIQTIYNMASYDMLAIHNIRTTVHELYVQSYDNFANLVLCYELLTQMLMVYKWNIPEKRRRRMRQEFDRFEQDLGKYMMPEYRNRSIPQHEFFELRKKLRKLIDYAYKAKNGIGLGIPAERRQTAVTKLDSAMGVQHVREKAAKEAQEAKEGPPPVAEDEDADL